MQPTRIDRHGPSAIRIHWSDGQSRDYPLAELRDACPCASCREKRSAPPAPSTDLPVLSASEAQPLSISGMKPVGNYAYSIAFSDGHTTGIYPLDLLRRLGQPAADPSGEPSDGPSGERGA